MEIQVSKPVSLHDFGIVWASGTALQPRQETGFLEALGLFVEQFQLGQDFGHGQGRLRATWFPWRHEGVVVRPAGACEEFKPAFEEDSSVFWQSYRHSCSTSDLAERCMEMLHKAMPLSVSRTHAELLRRVQATLLAGQREIELAAVHEIGIVHVNVKLRML
jgi:hypothetical protein